MNLSLLDPFAVAKEYPDTLIQTLAYGHSTQIRFSQKGDYLASGLADGIILIIDTDTNSTIQVLRDHTRAITSLCWSKCGRYLLSSSRDWKVNLWDLSSCKVIRSCNFECPVWCSVMNPANKFQFVAALVDNDPVFVDVENEPKITQLATSPYGVENPPRQSTLTVNFTPDAKYIFTGTSKGWLNVIETSTAQLVRSLNVCGSNIKNIEISPNSAKLAVNSSDRIIRQYTMPKLEVPVGEWEFELENRYQDAVNRLQWNALRFNHNSEYLCASTLGATHDVYIWETALGSLIKILEGSNDELLAVDWNYRKCWIVASTMDTGTLFIWSVVIPQKWSALAPDFEEIEQNIDYEEKEDEFDYVDEDDMNKQIEEEGEEVDILRREEVDARGFPFVDSFVIDSVPVSE
ncbi:hypothetical protein OGAPHI_007171 [Ogataea philodendri]|uniref:COMPASS component SWD1 n=1 Tax=Ogataea philodendri TaxID=1378263 RepID=A0A9P8NVF0_9ASCO|nr:uncharacterized protein OGAPHI_007171 [Ogataea philodendri]KAH3659966.1 hypothetical protein OGAPHI_007171 [Ogataea philodendri]